MNWTRRALYALPVLAFVGLGAVFALGLRLNPSAMPSTLIDRPLPEFDLPPIQGYTDGLSTEDVIAPGEVALVNVFASWCVPCLYEHPVLMELTEAGRVPIYGVNWKEKPGDGTKWLEQWGDPYARVGDDANGRAAIELGVTGAPETFIVDAQGRVRFKFAGPITPQIWTNTIEPIVTELEAE